MNGYQEERRAADARSRALEEEFARKARTERAVQYQKALGDDLVDMATRWSKAETVRAFLDAVEDTVPAATHSAGLTAWLAWARTFQRLLDPLGTPGAIAKKLDPSPETADGPVQAQTRNHGAR